MYNNQEESIYENNSLIESTDNQFNKSINSTRLVDYQLSEERIYWDAIIPDSSNYDCSILIKQNYLEYWYHGQCVLLFFINNHEDKIELLWSYKVDCLIDLPFLSNEKTINSYPIPFSPFASYVLIESDKIEVTYYYEKWIKEINEVTGDTIFPKHFYLRKSIYE